MGSAPALVLCALSSAAVSALATSTQNRPANSGCGLVGENLIDVTSFLQTAHNVSTIIVAGVPPQQEGKAGEPSSFLMEDAQVSAAGADVAARRGRRTKSRRSESGAAIVAEAYASSAGTAGRLAIGLAQLLQSRKSSTNLATVVGLLLLVVIAIAICLQCIPVDGAASTLSGPAESRGSKQSAQAGDRNQARGLLSGNQQVVDHSRSKDRSISENAARPDARSHASPPGAAPPMAQYTAAAQAPGFHNFQRCNSADSETPQNTPSSVASLPRFEVKAQPRSAGSTASTSATAVPEKPSARARPGGGAASAASDITTRAASSAAVTTISTQSAGTSIPAVMPSLVMATSEAHLNMSLQDLVNIGQGVALDIKSSSGKSALRCRLMDSGAGAKRIEVHSIRSSKDPALIVTVVQPVPTSTVLEVRSRGATSYGNIVQVSKSQARLILNDTEGMVFEVVDLQRFELVATQGGKQVGTALRALKGGFSVWNITIAPGADWPMIVAAFVSMLALDFPAGGGLGAELSRGA